MSFRDDALLVLDASILLSVTVLLVIAVLYAVFKIGAVAIAAFFLLSLIYLDIRGDIHE